MPSNFTAQQLLDAFDKWGVRYVEHGRDGKFWWQHTTSYPWDFEFILLHHDALNDSLSTESGWNLMWKGRPDLRGPLCQGWQEDDGWLHLTGWGNTNNAGRIAAEAWRRIQRNEPPTIDAGAAGWPDDGPIGNTYTWAIEIHNAGDGKDPYEDAQINNLVLMAAAICDLTGMSPKRIWGHRSVTRRKPDPRGLNLLKIIEATEVALFVGPGRATPIPAPGGPTEDFDMLTLVLDWYELYLGIPRSQVMADIALRRAVAEWDWRLTDRIDGLTVSAARGFFDHLGKQQARI